MIQHPKMAEMCPTSVNTIRIATLLGDKKQGIVYAFLRIGNGKVMDNVDQGGMAARIDLESGNAADRWRGQAGQHLHRASHDPYAHHRLSDSLFQGSLRYVPEGGPEGAADALRGVGRGYYGKGPACLSRATAFPATRCRSSPLITRTGSALCGSSGNLSIFEKTEAGSERVENAGAPCFLNGKNAVFGMKRHKETNGNIRIQKTVI